MTIWKFYISYILETFLYDYLGIIYIVNIKNILKGVFMVFMEYLYSVSKDIPLCPFSRITRYIREHLIIAMRTYYKVYTGGIQ